MKEASLIQGASLVSGALNDREVTGAMELVTMGVRSWRVELQTWPNGRRCAPGSLYRLGPLGQHP